MERGPTSQNLTPARHQACEAQPGLALWPDSKRLSSRDRPSTVLHRGAKIVCQTTLRCLACNLRSGRHQFLEARCSEHATAAFGHLSEAPAHNSLAIEQE